MGSVRCCEGSHPSRCSVPNRAVIFDPSLSLMPQIRPVRKFYWLYFQNVFRIQPFLTSSTAATVFWAISISYQDYCNCPLTGLPTFTVAPYPLFSKLQPEWSCKTTLRQFPWKPFHQKKKKLKAICILYWSSEWPTRLCRIYASLFNSINYYQL